jgi:hypothetical protein
MTEILMETKALPEPLFSMFQADTIRVYKENDEIRLIPVKTKDFTCPFLGKSENPIISVDDFLGFASGSFIHETQVEFSESFNH